MQNTTLGSLVGIALQLCAGAAFMIWPDHQWIAVAIFGLGLAMLIVSVVVWFMSNYRLRFPWIAKNVTIAPDASPSLQKEVDQEPAQAQRRELLGAWYAMLDDIEETVSAIDRDERIAAVRDELKRRSHYHRLARFLPQDVQNDVNAPSGISVSPALTIKGEETPDQALLRRLRSCIAAIEEEWGLLSPAQPTSAAILAPRGHKGTGARTRP